MLNKNDSMKSVFMKNGSRLNRRKLSELRIRPFKIEEDFQNKLGSRYRNKRRKRKVNEIQSFPYHQLIPC